MFISDNDSIFPIISPSLLENEFSIYFKQNKSIIFSNYGDILSNEDFIFANNNNSLLKELTLSLDFNFNINEDYYLNIIMFPFLDKNFVEDLVEDIIINCLDKFYNDYSELSLISFFYEEYPDLFIDYNPIYTTIIYNPILTSFNGDFTTNLLNNLITDNPIITSFNESLIGEPFFIYNYYLIINLINNFHYKILDNFLLNNLISDTPLFANFNTYTVGKPKDKLTAVFFKEFTDYDLFIEHIIKSPNFSSKDLFLFNCNFDAWFTLIAGLKRKYLYLEHIKIPGNEPLVITSNIPTEALMRLSEELENPNKPVNFDIDVFTDLVYLKGLSTSTALAKHFDFSNSELWLAKEYARIAHELEVLAYAKRYNFNFGPDIFYKTSFLHVLKTHSNLKMTLVDFDGCVILAKSAAMILGKKERRRRRKAPQTIESMIASFDKKFTFHKVACLNIILRIRPGQYINNIIKSLKLRKIDIGTIFVRRKLPFSFTRGRRKKY